MISIKSMEKEYYVYAYLNPDIIGKFVYDEFIFGYEPFYIGKGKGKRCYLGLNDNKNKIKKSIIEKIYSVKKEPIIIKIKSGISEEESFNLEISLIEKIGRIIENRGPLTNITVGGEGTSGRKDTPKDLERKRKFKHTEEWKKILSKPVIQLKDGISISEFSSIKEASEKTGLIRQNISSCLNGKYKKTGGFSWKYKEEKDILQGHLKKSFEMPNHTESTRLKMALSAKKGDQHPAKKKTGADHPRSKKIIQKSLDGDIIKIWNSISEINNDLGFTPSNICRCCKGSVKRIGGFKWEYLG